MPTEQHIVFVCEHGAAKSVLAATDFNALAAARGLRVHALARGTTPDSAVAPIVVDRLAREGAQLGAVVPKPLLGSDVIRALRVVTFDQPQVASIVPDDVTIVAWNGLPAVSADFDVARQAIQTRVRALFDDLERQLSLDET